jgi:hypothetical protein
MVSAADCNLLALIPQASDIELLGFRLFYVVLACKALRPSCPHSTFALWSQATPVKVGCLVPGVEPIIFELFDFDTKRDSPPHPQLC